MKNRNTNKGITLIALIITIIVLLILAAVSIATLTGENGILTKANIAKSQTDEAAAKEKVQLMVMGSYGTDGKLDFEQLKENLKKEGIPFDLLADGSIKANVDGYNVTVTKDGEVKLVKEINPTPNIPTTIKEAKEQKYIFNTKTTIVDEYDNTVIVPEGFKIASDSADDVTGGVVIEDISSSERTSGSQFVWIPVGTIYINKEKQSKTIELNRYTFAEDGTPTPQGTDIITDTYQELATSSYGNTTAKDIEEFKTSVKDNGGYYIGRYEARTEEERNDITEDSELRAVTVKANEKVYNYVTQPQAAKLSREMYGEDKQFKSDLMNSYAWDTALVFIQTFEKNDYACQTSLNTNFALTGTNNLTDTSKQDKICNIWDMASNCAEWTTETSHSSYSHNIHRGGGYGINTGKTGDRWLSGSVGQMHSFRILLYM